MLSIEYDSRKYAVRNYGSKKSGGYAFSMPIHKICSSVYR